MKSMSASSFPGSRTGRSFLRCGIVGQYEPLTALNASAEQLIAADTDFFIDCGTLDERGLSDQSQLFFLELLSILGNQSATFEAHPGDHASQLYTERLYASLIWLGQVLEEEASELP